MRGLNLSRLAARGRASEATFFKSQQSDQAQKLRTKLKPDEIAALSNADVASKAAPSVDILSEISAHSTYRTIIQNPSPLPAKAKPNVVFQRLANAGGDQNVHITNTGRPPVDSELLRALGSSRLGMLQDMKPEGRPLPSDGRYAQGAVLGIGAFGAATAIVGSIGVFGIAYVYTHPVVVDRLRERTVGFRMWMEDGVGSKLRHFVQKMGEKGPVLSKETLATAGRIAEGVGGRKRETNGGGGEKRS